jgi:hypothetical protein
MPESDCVRFRWDRASSRYFINETKGAAGRLFIGPGIRIGASRPAGLRSAARVGEARHWLQALNRLIYSRRRAPTETATIRIPAEKKNLLKTIASLERKNMNDIIVKLIDDYADRRKETLELLAIPGFLEKIEAASREIREGGGVSIEDVRKDLARKIHAKRRKYSRTSR